MSCSVTPLIAATHCSSRLRDIPPLRALPDRLTGLAHSSLRHDLFEGQPCAYGQERGCARIAVTQAMDGAAINPQKALEVRRPEACLQP